MVWSSPSPPIFFINPLTKGCKGIFVGLCMLSYCDSHYKIDIELDRKKAIGLAIHHAKPGDIVAILGKGHETYQEIQGVRYDFDDVLVASEMIQKWQP